MPKIHTLFCLVHIKNRSFLTSCVFWLLDLLRVSALSAVRVQTFAETSFLCLRLSTWVRVHIDQTFSMQQHINNLCRASFLELRRIKSVCPSMFENATAILVLSTVISRLDYRSATFAGISSEQLLRLQQRILNHAARLVMKRSKTPLLKELHSASCAVSVSVQTGNPGVPLL